MKKLPKILSAALALVMCLSLTGGALAVEDTPYYTKYQEPITLSTHTLVNTNRPYQEGDTPESNGFTRWCEKTLNIKWDIKWTASDGPTNAQKLDLAFASDDLPDLISPSIAQLSKYVASGKILPLDDLIEQYGSPILKWVLKDGEEMTHGATFKPFTFNGKLYAIPRLADMTANWTVNFIRSDILAELGMEVPTTLDEVEAVFEAYKAKYPSNYPLVLDNAITDGNSGLQTVLSAFNAHMNMWTKQADGSLAYTSVQPEMRDALAKAAEWYAKGYINPEFAILDDAKVSETVAAGNFLVYHGYWWSIGNPFGSMWINVPGSNVTVMPYLKTTEDTGEVMKSPWFTTSYAITSSCEHPEAIIYQLNLYLESMFRNETVFIEKAKELGYEMAYPVTEVREPLNKEEISKKYPNVTEPKFLWSYDYPEELTGPGYFNDFYTDDNSIPGIVCKSVSAGTYGYETLTKAVRTGDMSVLTPSARNTYNGWYGSNPKMLTTFADIYEYWSNLPFLVNEFAGASTATMQEKQSYLDKLQLETFTRVVMGTSPISAFDEYVTQWKANGGDQITAEVNEWHANVQ